jgi:hypothetical protein
VGHVEVQNWSSGVSGVSTGSGDNSDAQNSARSFNTSPSLSASTYSGHSSDDEHLSSKTSSPPSVCSQGAGQHRETSSMPVASTSYSHAVEKGIFVCVWFFHFPKLSNKEKIATKQKKTKTKKISLVLYWSYLSCVM